MNSNTWNLGGKLGECLNSPSINECFANYLMNIYLLEVLLCYLCHS